MKIISLTKHILFFLLLLFPVHSFSQLGFSWSPSNPQPGDIVTFTGTGCDSIAWYADTTSFATLDDGNYFYFGQGTTTTFVFPKAGAWRITIYCGANTITKQILIGSDLGTIKTDFVELGCNIITNYSFENYKHLPDFISESYFASGWYDARHTYVGTSLETMYNQGTSDYYHRAALSGFVAIPTNMKGYQEPSNEYGAGGNAYMGLYTLDLNNLSNSSYKEYLIQKLTTPMTAGKTYKVKFKVSLAESSKLATTISALFAQQEPQRYNVGNYKMLSQSSTSFIPCVPQITSPIITNCAGWTTVEGTVTVPAGQTYNYIIIGSFTEKNSTPMATSPCYSSGYYGSDDNYNKGSFIYKSAYYYIDEVLVFPITCCVADKIFGTDLNSVTYTSQLGLTSGQSASITGTLIVNSPIYTLNNNTIRFTPGSKVSVPVNTKLQVTNGSVLEACTDMWEGVFVDGEILFYQSTIRDAKSALNFVAASKWNIQQSILENNRRHIFVDGGSAYYNFPTTNIVKNNQLRCIPANMKSPYANDYTYNAIEVVNTRKMQIGVAGPLGDRNIISNASRGIYSKNNIELNVQNNHFEDIKCHGTNVVCGQGLDLNVAILADGDASATYVYNLKCAIYGDPTSKNTFNNCTGGVYTQNNIKGEIHLCTMTNIRDYGMFSNNNNQANNGVYYYENTIKHAKGGIYVYNIGNRPALILYNTISKENDYSTYPTYGIRVENPVAATTTYAVYVGSNTVTRYQWGINLNKLNIPYTSENIVTTNASLTSYPEGIRVDNCPGANIIQNTIAEDGTGGQSIGIRVESSSAHITQCNNITKNHIGMFFGAEASTCRVAGNFMINGIQGIYINYGNIGSQGTGTTPNLNRWEGSTWVYHLYNFASSAGHGASSNFNLKYLGTPFFPSTFLKGRNSSSFSLIPTTSVSSSVPNPSYVTECRGEIDGSGFVGRMFADTTSVPDSTEYREEIEWTKTMERYRAVKQIETGALDQALYAYKESLDETNTGKLDEAREKAVSGNAADAAQVLSQVYPANEIETKLRDVYTVAIDRFQSEGAWEFTEVEETMLNELAVECPYQYGEAVYSARSLLHAKYPDAVYANACEDVDWLLDKSVHIISETKPAPIAKVYPNPSTGDFVVMFDTIDQAQSAEVTVTDIAGRVRGTFKIFKGANMIVIEGNKLEAGTYICIVRVNGEVTDRMKIEKL